MVNWFHMEWRVSFPGWAAHAVKDQVIPIPRTGPPLASPAFPAESSASGSPLAAWPDRQPEEPPEPLPPRAAHPLAFQRPAGHCGSPPLRTAMLLQISFHQTAPLHLPPPPARADHRSLPPGRTQRKHYLGCLIPLEPVRLGGSPGSPQAWPDQLHSVLSETAAFLFKEVQNLFILNPLKQPQNCI